MALLHAYYSRLVYLLSKSSFSIGAVITNVFFHYYENVTTRRFSVIQHWIYYKENKHLKIHNLIAAVSQRIVQVPPYFAGAISKGLTERIQT